MYKNNRVIAKQKMLLSKNPTWKHRKSVVEKMQNPLYPSQLEKQNDKCQIRIKPQSKSKSSTSQIEKTNRIVLYKTSLTTITSS